MLYFFNHPNCTIDQTVLFKLTSYCLYWQHFLKNIISNQSRRMSKIFMDLTDRTVSTIAKCYSLFTQKFLHKVLSLILSNPSISLPSLMYSFNCPHCTTNVTKTLITTCWYHMDRKSLPSQMDFICLLKMTKILSSILNSFNGPNCTTDATNIVIDTSRYHVDCKSLPGQMDFFA